ncbi:MAG: FAD-binding protein [Micromonosporaceae bacterium]|nr:FAD-binding protein [Micromonosporaceae bacterium]
MGYDLVVIGGGAAGLGAARAAARARARVLLVSDGPPGGDCTFYGCVPSKTLIEAAGQRLAYPAAAQRVRDVVARVAATESAETLRGEGIEVMLGRARLLSASQVLVDGHRVQAGAIVLATGSRPAVPPIPGLATAGYLTNETVFDLAELPASLAVLGGGPIGCELAQAFARLGSRVTLVEAADRLLPREEPQASWTVARVLVRDGVEVRTGASVEKVDPDGRLALAGGEQIATDRLLVAVGRTPATDDLDLPAAGVATDDQGNVSTDEFLRTTAKGVCTVGDVTGRLQLTHAAYEMGRVAVGNLLGGRRLWPRRYRPHATPWVTFTDPEVGRVGLTEAQAADRMSGARVAYLPLSEVDRAVAADRTDGFVKLIAGPRRLLGNLGGGRIVGATIVADRAGEMIHEPALAMATRMFAGRLAAATHAYPTWSYAVQLAAAQLVMEIGGRSARPAERE